MAFMGVRISWLIWDRKTLLAVLLASAASSLLCRRAFLILPLTIIRITDIIKISAHDRIKTQTSGLE